MMALQRVIQVYFCHPHRSWQLVMEAVCRSSCYRSLLVWKLLLRLMVRCWMIQGVVCINL